MQLLMLIYGYLTVASRGGTVVCSRRVVTETFCLLFNVFDVFRVGFGIYESASAAGLYSEL